MVGWHCQLSGHEFEQALGGSDGQGSLVCCMYSMGLQRVRHDQTEQLSQIALLEFSGCLGKRSPGRAWKTPDLRTELSVWETKATRVLQGE